MLTLDKLGLCSWSLHPQNPDDLLAGLSELNLKKTQIALDPIRNSYEVWQFTGPRLWEAGVEMVSGMIGALGEDYSSPATIRETGGFLSDEYWEENLQNARKAMNLANGLDIHTITTHAGFIPEDMTDTAFEKICERIDMLARLAEEKLEGWLLLETGQETADTLVQFHDELMSENVGVNFDPANMILYNMGDPIQALTKLIPYVKQVHIKDALPPEQPGQWGKEVPIGEGAVDWPTFFKVLTEHDYDGHLIIEREAGDQRIQDIQTAIRFVGETIEASNESG